MKYTVIIVIYLISVLPSYACLSASQNRIFPIGTCSSGLVVVELQLQRSEYYDKVNKIESMDPGWSGNSFFKIYDDNYKVVHEELIQEIEMFPEYIYDSIITQIFEKGLQKANKLPNLTIAIPTSIVFCDYQQTCSMASLGFDTLKNIISVRLNDNNLFPVNVLNDPKSIAENLISYFTGFDGQTIDATSLKDDLYINSVRQFQIGEKKLNIVHLGIGQTFNLVSGGVYPPGNEYKADFSFSDLSKSVFQEPVLHHGHGFDFFILQ